MKSFQGSFPVPRFIRPRAGRRSSIVSLIFLIVFSARLAAHAQQKSETQPLPCAPSAFSQLIVSEGHLVRVAPAQEQTGAGQRHSEIPPADDTNAVRSDDPAARKAYKIFEVEARQGRPAAMVNLAVSSLAGWGAPPNAGAALYWLHAAAGRNFPLAFYDLGILYFEGCGVQQDYAQAFRFLDQGANLGDPASQTNLGYLYDQGLGVPRDRSAAARWYLRAAEQGEPRAQFNLGDLLLRGEGVTQDDKSAFEWFQKAALQGHSTARIMLGSMYAAGRGAPRDLQAAYLWISAASLQGDTRGNTTLLTLERQLTAAEISRAKVRADVLSHTPKLASEHALLH